MRIESTAFKDMGTMPPEYTCDGQRLNPPLSFSAIPQGTVSLTLIVHDPDAPGRDFLHWIVWNLPVTVTSLPAGGELPSGSTSGLNDFGRSGYGPPCPPSGTHRYVFDLFALDIALQFPGDTPRPQIEDAIVGHVLAQSSLTGLYSRNK